MLGSVLPMGSGALCLASPHGSLDSLESLCIISSSLNSKKTDKTRQDRVGQGGTRIAR